jgi:hypothetical protein
MMGLMETKTRRWDHLVEARKKAQAKIEELKRTGEWSKRVSEKTRQAMHRPDVRQRHLMGLLGQPSHFKGGNGQAPVEKVMEIAERLEPLGFIREFPIKTKGHNTEWKAPSNYKADFAHPMRKVVVEVDGPSHRCLAKRLQDEKKTAVLKALGWIVARVKH